MSHKTQVYILTRIQIGPIQNIVYIYIKVKDSAFYFTLNMICTDLYSIKFLFLLKWKGLRVQTISTVLLYLQINYFSISLQVFAHLKLLSRILVQVDR
jgi:hypothetical protein